jgi:cathepsin B
LLAAVTVAIQPAKTFESEANGGIFASWSENDKLRLMGTILQTPPAYMAEESFTETPDSFDSREGKFASCVGAIRDQGKCGSCWAEATSEAMSDRLCIATNGTKKIDLSAQDLVSCDKYMCMGCNGGIPYLAWQYASVAGIVSTDCFPYASSTGNAPACNKKCSNGEEWKTHKASLGSVKHYTNEEAIKTAIFTEGPVGGAFSVFEDFMDYKSGVYSHTTGKMLGGHAIKIIGWGEDNGVKYWTCANSWTTSWGENGFFRIKRGTNECGIEQGVVAGHLSATADLETVGEDSKVCTACKKAADAIVNKLINLVFQGTVVGGCSELCSKLPAKAEAEVCDGLCILAGEVGFETALAHARLNPESLCYDLRVCKH